MEKVEFGLIGKNLSHSFSKKYFTNKFNSEKNDQYCYNNFEIDDIGLLPKIIKDNKKIRGINITIPYKESIIPYLNKLSKTAAIIGAVNTIKINKKGHLKGYNTDYYGFKKSISKIIKHHRKALILGNGGASKAVAYALENLNIDYTFVSRTKTTKNLTYDELSEELFLEYDIIINCTPTGTFPNINECPDIPYHFFSTKHIAYDLVYNPEETLFLQKAKKQGALTKNGYEMLVFQAEKAWEIWNKKPKKQT